MVPLVLAKEAVDIENEGALIGSIISGYSTVITILGGILLGLLLLVILLILLFKYSRSVHIRDAEDKVLK